MAEGTLIAGVTLGTLALILSIIALAWILIHIIQSMMKSPIPVVGRFFNGGDYYDYDY